MDHRNNWELKSNELGRQWWEQNPSVPVQDTSKAPVNLSADRTSSDTIFRTNAEKRSYSEKPQTLNEAAERAVEYFIQLQQASGHFPGDYGGPNFLLPGLIITSHITQSPFPEPYRELMKTYILNHQNDDGGWGLHIEGGSGMFGTVLQYVSLRLLGMEPTDEQLKNARNWILKNGGATYIPSWGKFYLSVLGVYEWSGCNSLFPEMWLLPEWLPFHPSRYWCHSRMVYLPMAYCYGNKIKAPETETTSQLKEEIYNEDYNSINWEEARDRCAATDIYHHPSKLLKGLNIGLNAYEKCFNKKLREKALNFILEYINAEDEQTNFIDIGPVNQCINTICIWHAYGKNDERFKKHCERWFDYLWLAEDGMKMNGYNGSQLWDTAFAVQSILENNCNTAAVKEALQKAYNFIDLSQVKVEVRNHQKYYRHDSVGGWAFSTVEHGWPITDCTAEGLKTTLLLHQTIIDSAERKISEERLKQAADLLLSFQNNANGGWASYELTRAHDWLELLNPSEIFGNIMIDYSYTECSSACVQALIEFQKKFPDYRNREILVAIERGRDFILSKQRNDGSWYGSWAVCFTYGTWFAIEALTKVPITDKIKAAIEHACAFLISKQNEDGGWGEDFESCLVKHYVASEKSQVVNTSWALLTLMAAGYNDKTVIERGIDFLKSRQFLNGDFPQENISGVFNNTCAINYVNYRNIFPIWALGRYISRNQ